MRLSVSKPLVPSKSIVDVAAERKHYWKDLLQAWGVRTGTRKAESATFFPGANPCSVSRNSLPPREHPLVLGLKSDGVRYALFLTTRMGTHVAPIALMIDRAHNMYEVEVLAPEDFFLHGTLLEGELVWKQPDESTLLFLVFDALRVAGRSLLSLPFVERLAEAVRVTRWSEEAGDDVERIVADTGSIALVHFDPPVAMRPKRFVDRKHAARVWAERSDAEHLVDGLVLHRADAPYVHGTATDAVYKWKPTHTVDLAGPTMRAADGPLPPTLCGRTIKVLDSRVRADGEDDVAEYLVDVAASTDVVTLFAMRTRPDKRVANGLHVVEATVRDAMDALQAGDLA